MALKQLLIGKKISDLRRQLAALTQTRDSLITRRAEMKRREEELETSVSEMTEETSKEDRDAIDQLTQEWEADDALLTQEENENTEARENIERQIEGLEQELERLNERAREAGKQNRNTNPETGRKDETNMNTRKLFFGMNHQERDAFFAREEVKTFLRGVRDLAKQSRTVTGAELGVPTVVLDLVKEKVAETSKLMKHVRVRNVIGHARQLTMGAVQPAVWTEMCGKINEIGLQFNMVEVDGYKVAGYIRVCNSLLEDVDAGGDIALTTEIVNALGEAIGEALDMAITYGTGVKMPLGIVTRLAQASKPDNYPTKAREWKNLTGNIVTVAGDGVEFFKDLASKAGKMKNGKGEKFWTMSATTHMQIMAKALTFSATGTLVASGRDEMPFIGGKIEELDFIPDGIVIGGFGDRYLLIERAGTKVGKSEHVLYLDDETVFMGKARYDGLPVIAEAFMAFGIDGVAPTPGDVTFPEDLANA